MFSYQAHLAQYPNPIQTLKLSHTKSISLGDQHANVVRMIYELITYGVIKLPEKYYEKLCELHYGKDPMSLGKIDINFLSDEKYCALRKKYRNPPTQEEIAEVKEIINRIEPGNNAHLLVRFMGDILADRGKCCYYVLLFLAKLLDLNINYTVIFSNHDAEFAFSCLVRNFVNILSNENTKYGKMFFKHPGAGELQKKELECFNSLKNTILCIQKNWIDPKEIKELFFRCYVEKIKAIDVETDIDNKIISIFTHALCSVQTIFEENFSTLKDLCNKVNVFNQKLQGNLKNPDFFAENIVQEKIRFTNMEFFSIMFYTPFRFGIHESMTKEFKISGFSIHYVHGHIGPFALSSSLPGHNLTCSQVCFFNKTHDNLDNTLCGKRLISAGQIFFHCSKKTSLEETLQINNSSNNNSDDSDDKNMVQPFGLPRKPI